MSLGLQFVSAIFPLKHWQIEIKQNFDNVINRPPPVKLDFFQLVFHSAPSTN